MARFIIRLLMLAFILVPNGLSFWLWTAAQQTDKTGAVVAAEMPKGFSDSEPFVAEGNLVSPSDDSVESLEFHEPCLAFRTKVEFCYTTTDSDGELEDRRSTVLDKRDQVKDLTVDFGENKAVLDIQVLKSFYDAKFTDMENPPEYLEPAQIPTTRSKQKWFEVYENYFPVGQKVTVVGRINQLTVLEPHPEVGELYVYPGDAATFVKSLEGQRDTNKMIALICMVISVVVVVVLLLVERVAFPQET